MRADKLEQAEPLIKQHRAIVGCLDGMKDRNGPTGNLAYACITVRLNKRPPSNESASPVCRIQGQDILHDALTRERRRLHLKLRELGVDTGDGEPAPTPAEQAFLAEEGILT